MDCSVCFSAKGICICPKCSYATCRDCFKKWLFSKDITINCMNCLFNLGYDFIYKNYPKTFLKNELKDNILRVLEKKQKDSLPSIQEMRIFQMAKILQETEDFRLNIPFVSMDMGIRNSFLFSPDIEIIEDVAPWITQEIRKKVIIDSSYVESEIVLQQQELVFKIVRKKLAPFMKRIELASNLPVEPFSFSLHGSGEKFKCPYLNCSGLVLAGNCLKCLKPSCGSCWESMDEMHKCDPAKVRNVNNVKTDSKACPKCAVRIYRFAGCNHMTCKNCGTHFDYNTGRFLFNNNEMETINIPGVNLDFDTFIRRDFTIAYNAYIRDMITHLRNRLVSDDAYLVRLCILFELGNIKWDEVITKSYYFWRVEELEREERELLTEEISANLLSDNNVLTDEETLLVVEETNKKLKDLASKYDLAPLEIGERDIHFRRHGYNVKNKLLGHILNSPL